MPWNLLLVFSMRTEAVLCAMPSPSVIPSMRPSIEMIAPFSPNSSEKMIAHLAASASWIRLY